MIVELKKFDDSSLIVDTDDIVRVQVLPSDCFCCLWLKDGSFFTLHMSGFECGSVLWSAGFRDFLYDDPYSPSVFFDG